MRLLYLRYPISQTLSDLLGWSHWVELLKIDDPLERSFYEQQTLRERWSVRELIRQKDSALFLRLAASKDKAGILQLAAQRAGRDNATQLIAASVDITKATGRLAFKNRPKTASFRQKRSVIPENATKNGATTEDRTPATGRLDTKLGSDPDWAGLANATQLIATSEDGTRASGRFAIKNGPKAQSFRQKRPLIPENATKKRATTERRTPASGRFDANIVSQPSFYPALAALGVRDA